MRKNLRMLLLALTVLVVPAANAIDMNCFPGEFKYDVRIRAWNCVFAVDDPHCLVCYAVVTVEG